MGDDGRQLQGESQLEVMRAAWRIGEGTVEEIRSALPSELQSSYKTVQTLLNRLADRGLLSRTAGARPRGPTAKIVYRPLISEDEYLTESIERALDGASPEARDLALLRFVGRVDQEDARRKRRR
jgi:predicted transcriptional regulator